MEHRLRAAFSLPDPPVAASALLALVRQEPTADTVAELPELYADLAAEDPRRVDSLTRALVLLRHADDIPTISKNDPRGRPYQEKFIVVLDLFLHDMISSILSPSIDDDEPIVAPTHPFLVGSLLAASATKHDLITSSSQIGAVALGIRLPSADYENYVEPELRELSSIGACLQLLVAGSAYKDQGQLGQHQAHILPGLRSLLSDGVMQHASGKKLLQASLFSYFASRLSCIFRRRSNMPRVDLFPIYLQTRLGKFCFLPVLRPVSPVTRNQENRECRHSPVHKYISAPTQHLP